MGGISSEKNSHVQIFTIMLQSSFLSSGGETDACKEKYISVWNCLEVLLAGSSGPEEHNRKEGLGEQRERPTDHDLREESSLLCVVFIPARVTFLAVGWEVTDLLWK